MSKKENGQKRPQRIGIFAGTFDPIHAGHISFALQAIEQAQLDEVVFLPERRPRYKPAVEHFGHRVGMLQRAVKPHSKLSVLELVDRHFTVHRTWTQLQTLFPGTQLVLLIGSDVIINLPDWPHASRLLSQAELVVGIRAGESSEAAQLRVATWKVQPQALYVIESFAPAVSSGKIRQALRTRRMAAGLLSSVRRYARANWLYVSLPD